MRVGRPAMLLRRPASQRLFCLLVSFVFAAYTVRCEPGARMREGETTLVVYSYRHADPEALGNLQHFVSAVIKPQDPARYIIVVDQAMQQHGHMSAHGLPQLSANAEYLTIRDCFELGHVGKVLLGEKSSVHVSVEQYKYFVWLDSSAKGPLLPTNTLQGDHASAWHTLLTSRITATTKLVGANIVCEPIREDLMPYVEATVMATDTVGLQVLQKAKCFDCYATSHEAKMKGELDSGSLRKRVCKCKQSTGWWYESVYNYKARQQQLPCAEVRMSQLGTRYPHFSTSWQLVLLSWMLATTWIASTPPTKGSTGETRVHGPVLRLSVSIHKRPQTVRLQVMLSLVELQKFRSQGGEGFEAQQSEEYDEVGEEAAQLEQGIQTAQKVSDSLLEAGFVKPLQHEDPDADQEQTARIGSRLVESGFGRLQFEDAMEHSRQNVEEGIRDGDSTEAAEEIIADDNTRQLDFETTHVGDNKPIVHAGRTNVAEADRLVDLKHPGKGHVGMSEDEAVSKTCAGLQSEPAPRQGSHFEIAATGLAGEVAELDHDQGVDIAFYGDSITELWKYGLPETGGRSNVYWDNFGAYTSAILAVAGDQTSNLWWRMLHGETFEQHPPQMSVLLIGINDLAIAASCGASFVTDAADGIAQRITSMVSHLQHVNPDSEVLMVGILPCAAETSPGPEGLFAWPNGLSAGISQVNAALEGFASQHHLVHYVDCTDEMLLQGQISESVLPDGLHPNAEGMARLASCLSPIISRYVKPQQNA